MKRRVLFLAGAVFGLFALLIAHYFTLQVSQYKKWQTKAAAQHELIVKEPFKRGTFFADLSRGAGYATSVRPLVYDVTKFHLFIDPVSIPAPYKETIFKKLVELIDLPEHMVEEFNKQSRSRRLLNWLTCEQKKQVLRWWYGYAKEKKIASNALYFVTDYQRSYPYGCLLGQVLHTIQERKDELTDQAVPTGGLESYFNRWLQGKPGKRRLLRSPRHHLELGQLITQPEDGADVYLTIHPLVQVIAEQELQKGVAAAEAKGGWAIVMEAKTGYILALAQCPAFDPSQYRSYFNDPSQIELTKVHAVTDAHEIGSIIKPITLSMALQANRVLEGMGKPPIFNPEEKMAVTRTIFPGRASKPLYDRPQHKWLNMSMALQKSSNIYMAEVADRMVQALGVDWYRSTLINCYGFETKTGIELPAEAIGIVPSPKRFHPNGAPEWSLPTPYSLAIGYNLLATGMQMLRAYAIFANGGWLVQPTLVKKVVRGEQVLLDHTTPSAKRVLEAEDAATMLQALKYSTQEGGTGRLAAIYGYSEAGKTGSAEKIIDGKYAKKVHLSSFIGITPARPEITNPLVALISIDEPAPVLQENGIKRYLGARCAAPVFKEIMQRSLEALAVPPDDPHGYPKKDPRYDQQLADWVIKAQELRQLYADWNNK